MVGQVAASIRIPLSFGVKLEPQRMLCVYQSDPPPWARRPSHLTSPLVRRHRTGLPQPRATRPFPSLPPSYARVNGFITRYTTERLCGGVGLLVCWLFAIPTSPYYNTLVSRPRKCRITGKLTKMRMQGRR